MMDGAAGRALCDVVARHGKKIVGDPRRCEGLLRDRCPQLTRERAALVGTLREKIPESLIGSGMISELAMSRYTDELAIRAGLDPAAARWGVETWAEALGVQAAPPARPCPFCGSPATERRCASCGCDTSAPRRPCPKCAKLSPLGERACRHCGTTFTNEMNWKIPLIVGMFVAAFFLSIVLQIMIR
jgi:hypothetical protein